MRIKVNHNTMINRALSRVLKKKIDFNLNGITIDSRNIKKGDLFIALKGEKQHGAEFINEDIINKVSHIISDMKIDSDKFTFVEDSTEFLRNFSSSFSTDSISVNSHSQTTRTLHPFDLSSFLTFMSRSILALNFSSQKVFFVFGTEAFLQSL